MINFSAISKDSLIGKFLRGILKLIPKNAVLPIFQGELKGKKWIIGSGSFGYWLGNYELEKQKIFQQIVKKGDIVYDIGAHVGFYTLLASELVGKKGRVIAFEPLPENIFYLKKHLEINNCQNVEVLTIAVSEKSGCADFGTKADGFSAQFSKNGEFKVNTAALDDLIRDKKLLPPRILKIDVEGAELKVLKGAKFVLKKYKPTIFLAVHDRQLAEDCFNLLKEEFNYTLSPIISDDILKTSEIIAFSKKI